MFETKKDYNETEMRTLIELLYGSIAIKEQTLSIKIFFFIFILNLYYIYLKNNYTFVKYVVKLYTLIFSSFPITFGKESESDI